MSGSVSVKGLRTEGRIDVRDADVDVVVERAAPLAIYAEGDDPIEITPPPGGYQLDAVASDGLITLPPDTLDVATKGEERRATGPGQRRQARRSRSAARTETSPCDLGNC